MQAAGFEALKQQYDLAVPPLQVQSFVASAARRTTIENDICQEVYPSDYGYEPSLAGHLTFALKRETIDLRLLAQLFEQSVDQDLIDWVHKEPTGRYSRLAWFYYEFLTGKELPIDIPVRANYVPALDPQKYYTTQGTRSKRHKIINNLPGDRHFCPLVRRTEKLAYFETIDIAQEVNNALSKWDPQMMHRAASYLMTKETKSSFAIEGEKPSPLRTERFVQVLEKLKHSTLINEESLTQIQNSIVEQRYAAHGYRDFQNYIGTSRMDFKEEVHYVCPKPEDVQDLMLGWTKAWQHCLEDLPPIIAAAVLGFGFVFIHPFDDGNGRLHRYLIHKVLAERGVSPEGVIFPISAAILRDIPSYDAVLENFSRPVNSLCDWFFRDENIVVKNDTAYLYRYFDATGLAEYLYEKVIQTVHHDLVEELDFLAAFDKALQSIRAYIDMPDRKANLLVRLVQQNGGRLSQAKRDQFSELTDEELHELERRITAAMPPKHP